MLRTHAKRLLALILALMTLIGPVHAGAEDNVTAAAASGTEELVKLKEELTFISYLNYKLKCLEIADEDKLDEAVAQARATKTFSFDASDYVAEDTTAEVEVTEQAGRKCLSIGEEGKVTWKFDVEETGFYTMSFNYCAQTQRSSSIDRIFYINDKVPFQETRYVTLSKIWYFDYEKEPAPGLEGREGVFHIDGGGNETRPKCTADTQTWITYTMHDSNGFFSDPFEYYLKEGENTITLQSVGDYCYIDEFTFAPLETTATYEEYLKEHSSAKKAEDVEPVYINAEAPAATSHYTVCPTSDNSSAVTEPQNATKTVLNIIGGSKWLTNGQWVRYKFNIEKSGFYTVNPRYKQSINEGIFSSRLIRIDGEVPFEEARSIRFGYDNSWNIAPLSDDDGTAFEFYFEAGEHTIELEACLGDMGEILEQAKYILSSLNDDYREFTRLTGTSPDTDRTYGFTRIMPEVVEDLSLQSQSLKAIMSNINQTSGIKSDSTSKLEDLIERLRKMGADETKIASNLAYLKNDISTFGEWLSDMTGQPLEIDYILIQPSDEELPKANANFFQAFIYEIKKFFASFFADYDSISVDDDSGYSDSIIVWTTSGREQAQITNNIIKNGFTAETNVAVSLKLVANGTLLPAILAGTAPDVSIDAQSPIDYAIRGAVLPLNEFDTFDEVMSRFPKASAIPLSLYGKTYAVPTTLGVNVMFYRNDILASLGLSVPETWDELIGMIPTLKLNNMEIGMSFELQSMIFQYDAKWWKDDGMRIGFDDPKTLAVFEKLVNYYTQYSLPKQFDGMNRMKSGEMPLFLATYVTYNNLVVSAPEIAGLWEFDQIPGVRKTDENGKEYVDRTAYATSAGITMTKAVRNKELAWKFMDWFTDKDPQVDFCNEMVAILGASAKQAVANLEAFEALPWTAREREVLETAFENSNSVEAYPGDYMVVRYFNFAFNSSYNDHANPTEKLLETVSPINAELSRKRKEFNLMIAEEWDAVKAYTGLDTYYDTSNGQRSWFEFAEQNGIDDYEEWMKDQGISAENYVEWTKLRNNGETDLSYKDWVES
ncbi:MAG: extracellular solute-binding protein [Clostridia bacterium]|nr:extracellular solute-binding protein [Clostridia bacterium]